MSEKKAENYLDQAKMAIQDKDYAEAKKYILKSLAYHNTEQGYKLLAQCEAKMKQEESQKVQDEAKSAPKESNAAGEEKAKPSQEQNQKQDSGVPQAQSQTQTQNEGEDASPHSPASDMLNSPKTRDAAGVKAEEGEKPESKEEDKAKEEENIKICEEILKKTNYYEILGVDKAASEEEIKRQYKKLALKLHPDKNNAPQATDAFKKLAQALACLTNPTKRKIYDEHGNEENFRAHFSEFRDEDELDPEDLFDLLFNGSINPNRRRRRQGTGRQAYRAQAQVLARGKYFLLVQLAPFLLMMIYTIVMYLRGAPDPGYSLDMTEKHTIRRTIDGLELDYFVMPDFDQTHNSLQAIHEIEIEVAKAYIGRSQQECARLKHHKVELEEEKFYAESDERKQEIQEHIDTLDWTPCKRIQQIRASFT